MFHIFEVNCLIFIWYHDQCTYFNDSSAQYSRDDVDRLYVSRKGEEQDFPASKTAMTYRQNNFKTS